MLIYNYFLREVVTGKQVHIMTDTYLGDIGEKVTGKDGTSYIIENYADDYKEIDAEARYVAYCGGYND